MKNAYLFIVLICMLVSNAIFSQVSSIPTFSIGGTNFAVLNSPDDCQGYPVAMCGTYEIENASLYDLESLEVPGVEFELVSFDELNKTFCIDVLSSNFPNNNCLDVTVVLTFESSTASDVILTSNTETICAQDIDCECLTVEISNVVCYNSGTAQEEDDYWSFDIEVRNNTDEGLYWTTEPFYISGEYDVKKTILPGFISDFPMVTFEVFDTANSECRIKVDVLAPENCSQACNIYATALLGECQDNGTENQVSDDIYTVKIAVEADALSGEWEVYQTFTDGTAAALLGTGIGTQDVNISDQQIIFGDWVLSVFYTSDPACESTQYVVAPEYCSGCHDITISNIICYDNGTPSKDDDFWSFDLLVEGGIDSKYELPELDFVGFYGQTYTIAEDFIGECIDFTIIDLSEEDPCESTVTVCPPESCSIDADCSLSMMVDKFDCQKINNGNEFGFDMTVTVSGSFSKCWRLRRVDLNGFSEVVLEEEGDKSVIIGTFPELENFTLILEFCNDIECNTEEFIVAPDCSGFGEEEEIELRSSSPRVYPNPVRGDLLRLNLPIGTHSISIYNLEYDLVIRNMKATAKMDLNVEDLPIGMYILSYQMENGITGQLKFVKI